jgi:hypothetical protein
MENDSNSPNRPKNYAKLPDEVERELIDTILDITDIRIPFKRICDERKHIFGARGSELRKRVQKRREYLINNPAVLKQLARYRPKKTSSRLAPVSPVPDSSIEEQTQQDSFMQSPPSSSRRTRPSSPPRSSSSLSRRNTTMSDDQDDSKMENTLNFEVPWLGPCNGMIAVRGLQWEDPVTMQVVDKLSLYKPIFDIKDFQAGRYGARLSQNGDGIFITEPVVANFLWAPEESGQSSIQSIVDGGTANVCKVTEKSYKITTTRIKENKEYCVHEIFYKFPHKVTCNNEFFNNDSSGAPPSTPYKLVTKMHLQKRKMGVDSNGNAVVDFMPFVSWRMAIDGVDARTRPKQESSDNGLSDALGALGISLGTTGMEE